jgi:hypothetical protein
MAKEVNIHVKTTGAQQSKQEIDGVAQSAEKLGQTTEQMGAKTSRASSWIMDGLKSLIGPLGFAAIATTLAHAAIKVAQFFDNLKTRCDEAVSNVQGIRKEFTELFEAMDAFDERSRKKVTLETTKLLKETSVSKEIGLPIVNAYTRQFRGMVESGQLTEEQYQQGLKETLGYGERHGGAATAELITLMRGWGIATPEQQGAFRRQITVGADVSGQTEAELIEELGRSVPTAKAMGWTPAQAIEAVAVIAAGEIGRKKTSLPATTMQGLLSPQLANVAKYGISEKIAQDPQQLLMQLQQKRGQMDQRALTKMLTDIYGDEAALGVSKLLTAPKGGIRKALIYETTPEAAAAEQKEEQTSRETLERQSAKTAAAAREIELDTTSKEEYEKRIREIGKAYQKVLQRREYYRQWIREFITIGEKNEEEDAARRKWMKLLTPKEKAAIEKKYLGYLEGNKSQYEQAWEETPLRERYEVLTSRSPTKKINLNVPELTPKEVRAKEIYTPKETQQNFMAVDTLQEETQQSPTTNIYHMHYHNETIYTPRVGSDERGPRTPVNIR